MQSLASLLKPYYISGVMSAESAHAVPCSHQSYTTFPVTAAEVVGHDFVTLHVKKFFFYLN